MLRKIYGGTARNDQKSLCSNCRFATIVRGQTLDEEVVHCQSVTTRGMRVTFKVTSCTSHSDMDQPTYMQLLEDAWILKPASKSRPAGFVKHSELESRGDGAHHEGVAGIRRGLRVMSGPDHGPAKAGH